MAIENDIKKQDESSFVNLVDFYGKVSINGVEIATGNIKKLQIKEWIFDLVPSLELVIMDDGLFFDKFPLEEDAVISVELANDPVQEEPVSVNFLLQDYSVANTRASQINSSVISLTGIMETIQLFNPLKTKSYSDKSTSEIVESIANDIGLEPDIRVSTNDVMKWLQLDMTNAEMLRHVTDKSYKTDNDTNFCYSAIDKTMSYVSLNDVLSSEVKFRASFEPNKMYNVKQTNKLNENEEEEESDEIPLYYNDYGFSSKAGTINKEYGYGMDLNYYDLSENVTLKINSDNHPLTTNSFKLKSNVENLSKGIQKGIKSDNVHDNYFQAELQNEYLKRQFFTSYLLLTVRPVPNIKLFDKVFVNLPQQDAEGINNVHSGEYIITNITHLASSDGTYSMTLVLSRNGMNAEESLEEDFNTKLN